jgi:hypothetical protein
VQALLSLHKTGVPEQIPVSESQVWGLQGVLPVQRLGTNTQVAAPAETAQLSLVQALLSLQTTALVTQVPLLAAQACGLQRSSLSQTMAVLLQTPTPADA